MTAAADPWADLRGHQGPRFPTVEALLAEVPHLPGAACAGRAELFDYANGSVSHDRVRQALAICARCPALLPCRRWVQSLPADQKPHGIVCGGLVTGV